MSCQVRTLECGIINCANGASAVAPPGPSKCGLPHNSLGNCPRLLTPLKDACRESEPHFFRGLWLDVRPGWNFTAEGISQKWWRQNRRHRRHENDDRIRRLR